MKSFVENATKIKVHLEISDCNSERSEHVMDQQVNIQQQYALPTLYLYVLYLSKNKQRLVPLTS